MDTNADRRLNGASPYLAAASEPRLSVEQPAARLLARVERRVGLMVAQARQVIRQMLQTGRPPETGEDATIDLADLDRFAPAWAAWLPNDPETRASLAHLLRQRYQLGPGRAERVWCVLGLTEPAVQAAYFERYGDWPDAPAEADRADEADSPTAGQPALRAIEAAFEWLTLRKGEVLMRQGDPSDCMYLVVNGRLQVSVSDAPGCSDRAIAELVRGDTVGEMGLLTGEPRSTNVTASRDTALLRLSMDAFQKLMRQHPELLLGLTRVLVNRLRAMNAARPSRTAPRTTVLVGATERIPLARFAARLAQALATHGQTLHVSSARLASGELGSLTPASADEDGLVNWLNDQELSYQYLVYEADPAPSPWTMRCLRQADRVLVVADADEASAADLEARLEQLGIRPGDYRLELVLMCGPAGRPDGVRRWLERAPFQAHHHVREGIDSDVARLGRRLVGRAVGLALSGGGARAFAQLGAIRAIEERGIPIDLVVGSSAGAMVGALYAEAGSAEALYQRVRQVVQRTGRIVDFTVPLVSFLTARRLATVLRELFDDRRIEELWLPFFCTSSSLTRAEVRVHERGPIWRCLMASTALPGILPPVLLDDEVLVDGGLLDNLPVQIAAERCDGGPVLTVDVGIDVDLTSDYAFGHSVSGTQVLLSRLNPLRRANPLVVPSIISILLRTVELPSVRSRQTQRSQASLYLNPPVSQFGRFELSAFDRLVQIGYEHARERLAAWTMDDGA